MWVLGLAGDGRILNLKAVGQAHMWGVYGLASPARREMCSVEPALVAPVVCLATRFPGPRGFPRFRTCVRYAGSRQTHPQEASFV